MKRMHKPVPCRIETVGLENDLVGSPVRGLTAMCLLCRHQTWSFGISPGSVHECLRLMREECPCGASNDYGIEAVVAHPAGSRG